MPPSSMSGGSSLLRERLQNFLPQIKKSNEDLAQQQSTGDNTEAAGAPGRIDEDLFVLADENSEDSDSDSDIGLTEANSDPTNGVNSKSKATKSKDNAPAVEIKLSFGEVDDELLSALGEKTESEEQGLSNNGNKQVLDDKAPEIMLPGTDTATKTGFSLNAVSTKRIAPPIDAQATATTPK